MQWDLVDAMFIGVWARERNVVYCMLELWSNLSHDAIGVPQKQPVQSCILYIVCDDTSNL